MKYLVLLVAAWILACLVPISIYAQRSIGANSIVLDDGSGHTITLEVPPGLGSNYTYLLPPPPAGNAPAGFVVEGTSTGQTMYWNGATWVQSNFIANTNSAMGLGFVTIPPAFAFPITLNAAMGPATTSTLDLGDATHHFATLYVDNIIGTTGFADVWTRTGATVSPTTPGDNVTTSGNISTTGTGSLTSANGLTLTGTFGSNGSTGASGQVLMVNGAGNPVWTSPSALSTISFDNITSGLNTGAAMTLGAGASLLAGGGRIEATAFIGTGSTSDAIDLATTEVGGVLPIANGGTGIVSSGVSGNFLRSNGIAWVSSAIQASDIPNNNSNTSGSAGSFTGSLVGDVTGMQSATVVASVGGSTATSVHATVQTVSASTPNNIPFTLIERDGSGGFAAGDITGYAVSTHSLGVTTDLVVSGNTSLGGSIMTSLPAGVVHGGGFLDVGPVNLTSEVSNTLSVLHGGTGSANQAGARANLGAAASGVNNDITSLTGLTTPLAIAAGGTGATTASGALDNLLPSQAGNSGKVLQSNGTTASWQASSGSGTVTSVGISGGSTGLNTSGGPITAAGTITLGGTLAAANGGTGITASGASGNFLRSNGSSWASSAIQTGDLPANSSNYIQNQNGAPQTANFSITGTGTVGGSLTSNYEVISTFTGGGAIYGYGSIISGTSTNQGTFTLNDGAGVGAYHYASIAPGTLSASHTYLLPNIGLAGNTADFVIATDQGTTGQVLVSQGADAPAVWSSASGAFILNQNGSPQTANFNIAGTGTVGGSLTSNYEVISTFTGGGAIYGYGSIISGTSTNQGTFTLNDGAGVGAYHYASIAPGTLTASHTYLLPNIGLGGNTAQLVTAGDQGAQGQVLMSQGADAPATWLDGNGSFIANSTSTQAGANFNISGSGVIDDGLQVANGSVLRGGASISGFTTINGIAEPYDTKIGNATSGNIVDIESHNPDVGIRINNNGAGSTIIGNASGGVAIDGVNGIVHGVMINATNGIGGNTTIGNLWMPGSSTAINVDPAAGSLTLNGLNPVVPGNFYVNNGVDNVMGIASALDVVSSLASFGTFIDNSATQQSGATFNIDGSGTIGNGLTVTGTTVINGGTDNGSTTIGNITNADRVDINTHGGAIGSGVYIQYGSGADLTGDTRIGNTTSLGVITLQSGNTDVGLRINTNGLGSTSIGNSHGGVEIDGVPGIISGVQINSSAFGGNTTIGKTAAGSSTSINVDPAAGTLTLNGLNSAIPATFYVNNGADQVVGTASESSVASVIATTIAASGTFINNGLTLQPSSNFNISGNGYVGGSVGIGTTGPSQKLEVSNGNVLLSNSGTATQLQLQGSGTGISTFQSGAQGATNINYILPVSLPSANQVLAATSVGGSAVTLGWASAGGSGWATTGNALAGTEFIGTTNASDLIVKTNGTERLRVLSGGAVGINTNAPGQALEVKDGNLLLSNSGTATQLQLQGTSTGVTTFQAGAQGSASINYTLPISQPTANQVLAATGVSGSGPYAVTLGWASAGASGPVFATNSSNQDYTGTTLSNVSGLSASVEASATYTFDGFIMYTDPNNFGFGCKFAFTSPSGSTLLWGFIDPTSTRSHTIVSGSGTETNNTFTANGTIPEMMRITGILITGGTSGSLQFQDRKTSSGTDPLRINAHSYITLTRVQ